MYELLTLPAIPLPVKSPHWLPHLPGLIMLTVNKAKQDTGFSLFYILRPLH